jgi:hypothetical protein
MVGDARWRANTGLSAGGGLTIKIIVSFCRKIGSVQETLLVSLKPLIFRFQNQNLNKAMITLAKSLLIIMKMANLTFGKMIKSINQSRNPTENDLSLLSLHGFIIYNAS